MKKQRPGTTAEAAHLLIGVLAELWRAIIPSKVMEWICSKLKRERNRTK